MLATIGDLVEDVIVRLAGPVNIASDTPSAITRRRGGSAANVAATAAASGFPTRFLGQVGDDATGAALVARLERDGVDVTHVRRRGTTGTIVVLVDGDGERSMLTDRAACLTLDEPESAWLDEVTTLHVPFYSMVGGPLADTTATIVGLARERGIAVSVDLSSTTLLRSIGVAGVEARLAATRPAVVFANADEAAIVGLDAALGDALTIVKRGPDPVVVLSGTERFEVPVAPIAAVTDTTGAGDAFAAGFLTHDSERQPGDEPAWLGDPAEAVAAGNRAAAAVLTDRDE